MTVFILVDGIHELPHTPKQKDSLMKQTLDAIAETINASPYFCIAAVAGTFYTAVDDVLEDSPQKRVYMTPL
jgi:hypothetical protein